MGYNINLQAVLLVIRLIEKKGLGSRKNYCFHIVGDSISATHTSTAWLMITLTYGCNSLKGRQPVGQLS